MANTLFNADNLRTLVLLVAIVCGIVWQKLDILKLEHRLRKEISNLRIELLKAMDDKLIAFHAQLKNNDFAHLNSTIEALTFTLEKNKFLTSEDKAYIDGRLDK